MKLSCIIVALTLVAGCGSADPTFPGSGTSGGERLLPLAVGATWVYRVTKDDVVSEKTTTVEALETLDGEKAGISAYRIRTVKSGGETVSWQQDTGTAILRHLEASYDDTGFNDLYEVYKPAKLRVDEDPLRTALSATFVDTYTEVVTDNESGTTSTNDKSDTWTVVSVDDEVSVPAGTFSCILFHRQGMEEGQSDKYYWFFPGVGKIKEAGGQLEELMSYTPGE